MHSQGDDELKALPWREILTDVGAICGASLVSFGAYMIYEPAGLITGGVMVLTGSILLAPKP